MPENAGAPFRDGKRRLCGVEIEYNEVANTAQLLDFERKWRCGDHYDGSCGREVVTPPLSGKYVGECLRALSEAMTEAGGKADSRCGVHVHVDAKDLSWHDIYRLCHVYAKVEPILYLIAGQHRVKNTYCSPIGAKLASSLGSVDRKGSILATVYNAGKANEARDYIRRSKPGKKSEGRYKGLNLCPWLAGRRTNDRRGRKCIAPDTTVEFRIHRNTLDGARLTNWANLVTRLVDWCATHSDREAAQLPRSALRTLCEIAPDQKEWILHRIAVWRKVVNYKENDIPRRMSNKGGVWSIKECAA